MLRRMINLVMLVVVMMMLVTVVKPMMNKEQPAEPTNEYVTKPKSEPKSKLLVGDKVVETVVKAEHKVAEKAKTYSADNPIFNESKIKEKFNTTKDKVKEKSKKIVNDETIISKDTKDKVKNATESAKTKSKRIIEIITE